MGKGKGKLACWFVNLTGGTILFELRNLRYGRARFYLKQATFKLGIPTKHVFTRSVFFAFPLKVSKTIFLRTFW